jgi:putative aldouronate transport system permease protein
VRFSCPFYNETNSEKNALQQQFKEGQGSFMEMIANVKDQKKLFRKKDSIFDQYRKCKYLFILLLPVILFYLIFYYVPIYGIVMGFQDFYPNQGIFGSQWVGFEHFKQLFTGMYFLPVLRNTLIISFYKLVFGFPAPILLALLFNEVRNMAFKRTVQTLTYLPYFISWVVLAGIVTEVLSPSHGIVNYVIQLFGGQPIFFVADSHYFRGVLVLSSIWRQAGWQSVIFMAAISGIDPELYDVAALDGAGRLRVIWNITLPSILPVIVIMFIFAVGNLINDDFDQVYNLLNAKVMDVGDVISTYTFREGLQNLNYSYATAVGLFKNVVALSLVLITNFIAKKTSGSSVL